MNFPIKQKNTYYIYDHKYMILLFHRFTHQTMWLEYQAAIQKPSYFDFIQRWQLRGKSLMLSIKVTSPAEGGSWKTPGTYQRLVIEIKLIV